MDTPLVLKPLKNSLEGRPTVLRTIRFLELTVTLRQFSLISCKVFNQFNGVPNKVNQRLTGRYPKKVSLYPPSFIPKMIEIIKEQHKLFYPELYVKKKRKRIIVSKNKLNNDYKNEDCLNNSSEYEN